AVTADLPSHTRANSMYFWASRSQNRTFCFNQFSHFPRPHRSFALRRASPARRECTTDLREYSSPHEGSALIRRATLARSSAGRSSAAGVIIELFMVFWFFLLVVVLGTPWAPG